MMFTMTIVFFGITPLANSISDDVLRAMNGTGGIRRKLEMERMFGVNSCVWFLSDLKKNLPFFNNAFQIVHTGQMRLANFTIGCFENGSQFFDHEVLMLLIYGQHQ